MRNLLKSQRSHPFQISMQGVMSLFSSLHLHLPGSSSLTEESAELLEGTLKIIEGSENAIKYLENKTPFIKQHFGIHLCLLSDQEAYQELGMWAVEMLSLTVPGYSKWEEYVQTTEQTLPQISSLLSGMDPAPAPAAVPSSGQIEDRQLALQSANLVQEITGKKEARPAQNVNAQEAYNHAIEAIFESKDRHSSQRQEEILDSGEILTLNAISRTCESLAEREKIPSTGDNPLDPLQRKLAMLHRAKWDKREHRLRERQKQIDLLVSQNVEVAKTLQELKGEQEKAIELLQNLYAVVEKAIPYINVSSELCCLNQNLCAIYEVSVSIVISGLVSMGKSTVVNCFIGQNLSPHRTSAMTAIPTRYIHSASQEEPVMLVPFASQLNRVLDMIRRKVKEIGKETLLELLPGHDRKKSLRVIADDPQYAILPQYVGPYKVVQATEAINDLYRLAAHEAFGDEVFNELPQDWSRGLDHYLTVTLKFPDIPPALNLLEFCIVDTPGIDEANAKRLSLDKVLVDAMEVSNYIGLVSDVVGLSAEGIRPLLEIVEQAKERMKVPSLALVTRVDGVSLNDRSNVQRDAPKNLSGREGPLFLPDDIFLVNALYMSLALQMRNFLRKNMRKPDLNDQDPLAQTLADDWVFRIETGIDEDEKVENYESQTVESLQRRVEGLISRSNMVRPIERITDDLSTKAIRICVRAASHKVIEKIAGLAAQLEVRPDIVKATQALEKGKVLREDLGQLINDLRKSLENEAMSLSNEISDRIQAEVSLLKTRGGNTYPLHSSFDSLLGFLCFHFSKLESQVAKNLISETQNVNFPNPSFLQTAISEIQNKISAALEDFLMSNNDNLLSRLSSAQRDHRPRLNQLVENLQTTFETEFRLNISTSELKIKLKEEREKITAVKTTIGSHIKKTVQKPQGLMQFLQTFHSKNNNISCIDPTVVRRDILHIVEELGKQWAEIMAKKINDMVGEMIKPLTEELVPSIDEAIRAAKILLVSEGAGQNAVKEKNEIASELKQLLDDPQLLAFKNL